MKYFYIDGTYVPKHCLWGPRYNEGLIFNEEEWKRINDRLSIPKDPLTSGLSTPTSQEYKKILSRNMTCTWENTLAKVKSLDHQKKLQEIEQEKQAKIDEYHKIINSQKMEVEKVLDNAKNIVYQSKDTTKQLSSGWMHSAVLHERNNQVKFNQKMRMSEIEKHLKLFEKREDEAECIRKERFEEIEKEKQKKLDFRNGLSIQMQEASIRKEDDLIELEWQKKDLENMKIELKMTAEKEKNILKEAKEKLKADIEEFNKKENEIKEARRRESEEDDKINQIYTDIANNIDEERKAREKKFIKDAHKARSDLAFRVAPKVNPKKADEQIEAERLQNEEKELKRVEERREKKEKLLQDLLATMKEAEEKIEERRIHEMEKRKWEVLHKEKLQELNQIWLEREREKNRARILSVRSDYMKQWQENTEKKLKEKEEDNMFREDLETDKQELLKYCDEVLNAAKELQRPVYPVLKAIEKVKRQLGIWEIKKPVPFLRSNVPIESVAVYALARKRSSTNT